MGCDMRVGRLPWRWERARVFRTRSRRSLVEKIDVGSRLRSKSSNLTGSGRRNIELEQMDSADAPLVVDCIYAGRHLQRRGRISAQVYELDGPVGSGRVGLNVFYGDVLVRAPVRDQVAERAADRLNCHVDANTLVP